MKAFLEGPAFDRAATCIASTSPTAGSCRSIQAGEFAVVAQYDGEPNGLKIHRDGRLFVADHRHGVMVVDPVSGRVEPYLTRPGSSTSMA